MTPANLKDDMSTDQAIEDEIQAKGLIAPRITPGAIEDNIAGEYYFTGDTAVGKRGTA